MGVAGEFREGWGRTPYDHREAQVLPESGLPKGHAKAKIVPMRLNDADLKLFTKAARANGQSLSEWMRSTLSAEVQK